MAGLVGNEEAIGERFHITSDEALTWNRITAETAVALGVEPPVVEKIPVDFICERFPETTGGFKSDKVEPGVFDNAKIKRLVPDFVCRKPFAVGIRESVDWLRSHPEDQQTNPKADEFVDRIVAAWRARKADEP